MSETNGAKLAVSSAIGAGIGALIGIAFVSCAEYIWFYPRDMFAHLIVLGILAALVRNIGKKGE